MNIVGVYTTVAGVPAINSALDLLDSDESPDLTLEVDDVFKMLYTGPRYFNVGYVGKELPVEPKEFEPEWGSMDGFYKKRNNVSEEHKNLAQKHYEELPPWLRTLYEEEGVTPGVYDIFYEDPNNIF